jgi:Asp-tRNA(Asn)/Glu-tRNA(Gln) amidotransferase C subunit
MEIEQSIFREILEYARLMRSRSSKTGLIVDLSIIIHAHPELQELKQRDIVEIIENVLEMI